MAPTLVWFTASLLILVGLLGSVLPGLPGAPLILAGAVVLEIFLPQYLSWVTLALLAILAAASAVMDAVLAAAGGRRMGASSWGILGAGLGAVVGIFFGPAGLVVGVLAGAVLCEVLFARKTLEEAARAGLGAGLGLLASTAGKAAAALLMVGLFLADCFVFL